MPPRRGDPAYDPDAGPPDSYASIWFELSEVQRSAILAAIGSTVPPPRDADEVAQTPAVLETMQALRRELIDEDIVVRESSGSGRPAGPRAGGPAGAGWGWHPRDNGLLAATFDPALIVGGSAPERGDLVCQRVTIPAGAPIRCALLEVVTPGTSLAIGGANIAAVYESDGTRAGWTEDQAAAWAAPGLQRGTLVQPVPPQAEPRSVWVAFLADGATMPGFAVPWISRAARPNLGLPSPGPQRAGRIPGQSTCPEAIAPNEMQAGPQYWVGLA